MLSLGLVFSYTLSVSAETLDESNNESSPSVSESAEKLEKYLAEKLRSFQESASEGMESLDASADKYQDLAAKKLKLLSMEYEILSLVHEETASITGSEDSFEDKVKRLEVLKLKVKILIKLGGL